MTTCFRDQTIQKIWKPRNPTTAPSKLQKKIAKFSNIVKCSVGRAPDANFISFSNNDNDIFVLVSYLAQSRIYISFR